LARSSEVADLTSARAD